MNLLLLGRSRRVVTFPGELTVSGNEITPATRAAGTEGDGLSDPSSFGIFRATTNLWTNGGAETNVVGLNPVGSATVYARATDRAKFGVGSVKLTRDATTGNLGWQHQNAIAVSENAPFTLSGWVYLNGASGMTGARLTLRNVEVTGGTAQTNEAQTGLATDQWVRVNVTRTMAAGVTAARGLFFHNASAGTGNIFWCDGMQYEAGAYETPYVETNGAAATRNAARVRQDTDLMSASTGAVAVRLTPWWANTQRSDTPVVWQWKDDASNFLELRYNTTADQWEFERRDTGGTATVAAASTWNAHEGITLVATWDATTLYLSVDGSARASQAGANIPTLAATTADIGSNAGADSHLDGLVHWVLRTTATLDDGDCLALHAHGDSDPPLTTLPAGWVYLWRARDASEFRAQE